jgi:uncharacterized membrane protein YidH (DUF202 family)
LIRAIALGVLAGGIALTVFGVNASHSFGSEVSRVFTGNPSDHSMWLIGGGVALIVTGAAGLFMGGKKG